MRKRLVPVAMIMSGLVLPMVSGAQPDPAWQEVFEERREIESISHRERIRILQEAEDCIREAGDFRAYRACERQEKQAREALRERLRPRLQALQAEVRELRRRRSFKADDRPSP